MSCISCIFENIRIYAFFFVKSCYFLFYLIFAVYCRIIWVIITMQVWLPVIIMFTAFFHLNHWFFIKYFMPFVFSMLFLCDTWFFEFRFRIFILNVILYYGFCVLFLGLMSCKCPVFLYFVSCKMSCIFMTACYDHWYSDHVTIWLLHSPVYNVRINAKGDPC